MKPCVSSWRMSFAAFRCRSVAAAGDSLFFCFAKSKVSKRKGDPTVCVPPLRYGQPAVLSPAGVSCKLASLKQARALFRLALRSSAHTDGFCETDSDSGSECSEVAATVFTTGVVRDRLRVRPNVGAPLERGVLTVRPHFGRFRHRGFRPCVQMPNSLHLAERPSHRPGTQLNLLEFGRQFPNRRPPPLTCSKDGARCHCQR